MNGVRLIVEVFGLATIVCCIMMAVYLTEDLDWNYVGNSILKILKLGVDKLKNLVYAIHRKTNKNTSILGRNK